MRYGICDIKQNHHTFRFERRKPPMTNETQDERYSVADEAIYDAFFLILKEKELDKQLTTEGFSVVQKEGNRTV